MWAKPNTSPGNYAGARQSLRKELSQHPSDHVAMLYLGLAEARLGNRQAALGYIENGMKGIAAFLNYITTNFAYSFGQFWDPSGNIRASIKQDLTLIPAQTPTGRNSLLLERS